MKTSQHYIQHYPADGHSTLWAKIGDNVYGLTTNNELLDADGCPLSPLSGSQLLLLAAMRSIDLDTVELDERPMTN